MNRFFLALIGSLLITCANSAQATFNNMESLEEFISNLQGIKSMPAAHTFYVDSTRTAAGVLHYSMDEQQRAIILLGSRNDDKTYCNLGGMSDSEADYSKVSKNENIIGATLANTASREVEEESNGYYAHHPSDLERQPYIDILTEREKGKLLYRMYWKRVKKVDGDILLKATTDSKIDHNKEYEGFIWAPVDKILEAVSYGKTEVELDGRKFELFKPLFQILSTSSGINFLKSIANKCGISFFNKDLRHLHNRLYLVEAESSDSDEIAFNDNNLPTSMPNGTSWSLSEVPSYKREMIKVEGKGTFYYKAPSLQYVPFGSNAWGQNTQTYKIGGQGNVYEALISVSMAHKYFANAVAAHGAAMVELKNKYKKAERKGSKTAVEGWNPNCDLILSRIHLRMVLGKDFKAKQDFENSKTPQRDADLSNLRIYLSTHSDVEYSQKKVKPEFKRQINFSDHDLEILADILEWEENNKNNPVFYHGATADINNLWQSFTHMREMLAIRPLVGQNVVLRGTDIYFRKVKTMAEIIKLFGKGDYENGKANVVLCANYVLSAGLTTTRTTSSSIEYFLNNHSVEAPDVEAKFVEAMSLAGIIAHYPHFRSPFLQFLAHRNKDFENSVMLGISIPANLLLDNTCTDSESRDHIHMSILNDSSNDKNKTLPITTLDIFSGIQDEYESHKEIPEDFRERTEEKRSLIPEARLTLHPNFVLRDDVHIKAFNRFPLTKEEQKNFEKEMRSASISTIADWLLSHFKVMPDSFVDYPKLKRLYQLAYKGTIGEEAAERVAFESFSHLLTNGHIEGAREYLNLFPDILKHPDFDPLTLAIKAIRHDNLKMLKFICKEMSKKAPREFFANKLDFYKAVRIGLAADSSDCIDYIWSNWDLKTVPAEIIQTWIDMIESDFDFEMDANHSDREESLKKTEDLFLKHFPDEGKQLLLNKISEGSLEVDRLAAAGFTPQMIFEEYGKVRNAENNQLTSCDKGIEDNKLLNLLKENNMDLASAHSKTGFPLVFELRGFTNIGNTEVEDYIKAQLPTLIECKDMDGKTIFDYVKMDINKKRWSLFLCLLKPDYFLGRFFDNGKHPYDHICCDLSHINEYNYQTVLKDISNRIDEAPLPLHPKIIMAYKELMECEFDFKDMAKKLYANTMKCREMIEKMRDILLADDFLSFYYMWIENKIFWSSLYREASDDPLIMEFHSIFKKAFWSMNRNTFDPADDALDHEDACLMGEILVELNYPANFQNKANIDALKEKIITFKEPKTLKRILTRIIQLNNYDLVLKTLQLSYPDKDEFISLGAEAPDYCSPFKMAVGSCGESVRAIMDYTGDRFPELVEKLNHYDFEDLMDEQFSYEDLKDLIVKYPYIFTYADKYSDHFRTSLQYMQKKNLREFVEGNQEKLLETDKTSIPYFWYLAMREEKEDKSMPISADMIKRIPAIIELQSLDGLTLEDFSESFGFQKSVKAILKKHKR